MAWYVKAACPAQSRFADDSFPEQAAWSRRIFELRAALDLYLAAMRRLENERNYTISYWRREPTRTPPPECKAGTCPHRYPRLVFDHESTTPLHIAARASAEVFYLSPLQISRHLARPHKIAKTDRFSHPLFFARSGFPFPDTDIDEEGQNLLARLLAGPHDQDDFGQWHILEGSPQSSPPHNAGTVGSIEGAWQEGEDWPNVTSPGAGDASDYLAELARPLNASDQLVPHPETVGGLLAMGRSIIAMAPNVDNLSLTGYFNRLLCSSILLASQNLRCLSIGPTLPYWKRTFRSQAVSRFPKLEHLRLCVPTLTTDEISLIAGGDPGLKRLKSVQWEVADAEEPTVMSVLWPSAKIPRSELLTRFPRPTRLQTSSFSRELQGARTPPTAIRTRVLVTSQHLDRQENPRMLRENQQRSLRRGARLTEPFTAAAKLSLGAGPSAPRRHAHPPRPSPHTTHAHRLVRRSLLERIERAFAPHPHHGKQGLADDGQLEAQ